MNTSIRPCTCEHAFQDATYGEGNRVFNTCGRKDTLGWICTVCSRRIDRKKHEGDK